MLVDVIGKGDILVGELSVCDNVDPAIVTPLDAPTDKSAKLVSSLDVLNDGLIVINV